MSETPEKSETDADRLARERTNLALQRTIIAADRTLMAWIRTSISMIGFGFSIFKFFEYLRQAEGFYSTVQAQAPRHLGLALIALGTIALVVAIYQYWHFLKRIGAAERINMWPLSVIVAISLILIGAFAFLNVLLRTGPF
jgi:putative membrane protein